MTTGLDCKTYKGTTGAGGRVFLARPASTFSLAAQGTSAFWVKPNAKGATLGTIPAATPDPATEATADGWIRVAAVEAPPTGGANNIPLSPEQTITSFDVWCEASGYLVVLASEGLPSASRIS